jgi:hypothetical protein
MIPLSRIGNGCNGNIKISLREIACRSLDWMDVAQDRPMAGSCEHSIEASGTSRLPRY